MKFFKYILPILIALVVISCHKDDNAIKGLLEADLDGEFILVFSTEDAVFSNDGTTRTVRGTVYDDGKEFTLKMVVYDDGSDEYLFVDGTQAELELVVRDEDTGQLINKYDWNIDGKLSVTALNESTFIGTFDAVLQAGFQGPTVNFSNGVINIVEDTSEETMIVN